jgi:hypothetical protein
MTTAPPSEPRFAQGVPEYTLEYQLFDFAFPTESDLVELEAVTRDYLRNYFMGTISNSTVLLEDFVTIYVTQTSDPGALVVKVSYESTVYYSQDSSTIPPQWVIEQELDKTFSGDDLSIYLQIVQRLPNSNLFAGTIQIFEVQRGRKEAGSSEESSSSVSAATTAIIVCSSAIVILLSGCGLFVYQRRNRLQRNCNSKGFHGVIGDDESPSSCSTETDESGILSGRSGNLSHQHSKEVWARYKSTESLAFGEESYVLGHSQRKEGECVCEKKKIDPAVGKGRWNASSSAGKNLQRNTGGLDPRGILLQELKHRLTFHQEENSDDKAIMTIEPDDDYSSESEFDHDDYSENSTLSSQYI